MELSATHAVTTNPAQTVHMLERGKTDIMFSDATPPTREEAKSVGAAISASTKIEKINFYKTRMTKEYAMELSAAFQTNTSLREVEFREMTLDKEMSLILAAGVGASKSISKVVLFNAQRPFLPGYHVGALAFAHAAGDSHTITHLDLRQNKIESGDVTVGLGLSLDRNRNLTTLYVDLNKLGDDGVQDIAQGNFAQLEVLSMAYNEISDVGVRWLMPRLTASAALKVLDVSFNNVTDEGIRMVTELVRTCPSLHTLDLYHNKITDASVVELCEAICESPSMFKLDLSENKLTDVSGVKVAEALAACATLGEVNLETNPVTDVTALKVAEALRIVGKKHLKLVTLENTSVADLGAVAMLRAFAVNAWMPEMRVRGRQTTDLAYNLQWQARTQIFATRPTLWLLMGRPLDERKSPCVLWRKFICRVDGDHAVWARVMDFLAGKIRPVKVPPNDEALQRSVVEPPSAS